MILPILRIALSLLGAFDLSFAVDHHYTERLQRTHRPQEWQIEEFASISCDELIQP